MNVYVVSLWSEKSEPDTWYVPAGEPKAAISRALAGTQHQRGERLNIKCVLMEKNIKVSFKEWKEKNLNK